MNPYILGAVALIIWLLPRLIVETVVLFRVRRRPLHERLLEDDQ